MLAFHFISCSKLKTNEIVSEIQIEWSKWTFHIQNVFYGPQRTFGPSQYERNLFQVKPNNAWIYCRFYFAFALSVNSHTHTHTHSEHSAKMAMNSVAEVIWRIIFFFSFHFCFFFARHGWSTHPKQKKYWEKCAWRLKKRQISNMYKQIGNCIDGQLAISRYSRAHTHTRAFDWT